MRPGATGGKLGIRVHSTGTSHPKRFLGVVAGLVAILLALPVLTAARTSRTTTARATATSSSKKKSSKKHRKSSRQSTQKAPTPDRISEIQAALARGGYFQGDPTGKWDATTVAAMQKFQSSNGLEANGKLDALSLQKLGLGSDIAGVSAPKPVAPHGSATSNTQPATGPGPSASTAAPASEPPSTTSSSGNLRGGSSVVVSSVTAQQ